MKFPPTLEYLNTVMKPLLRVASIAKTAKSKIAITLSLKITRMNPGGQVCAAVEAISLSMILAQLDFEGFGVAALDVDCVWGVPLPFRVLRQKMCSFLDGLTD